MYFKKIVFQYLHTDQCTLYNKALLCMYVVVGNREG